LAPKCVNRETTWWICVSAEYGGSETEESDTEDGIPGLYSRGSV